MMLCRETLPEQLAGFEDKAAAIKSAGFVASKMKASVEKIWTGSDPALRNA